MQIFSPHAHLRHCLHAAFIGLLSLGALAIAALPASAALAPTQIAAAPRTFDDWSPSGRRETPPGTQPVPNTTNARRLAYASILGKWCSPDSNYLIERGKLIVRLKSGGRVVFPITRFIFNAHTIDVRWTSNGRNMKTIFGLFSSNRRRMVQFGVNRTYKRC